MIGLSEHDLYHLIGTGGVFSGVPLTSIPDQNDLFPSDVLRRLAAGIAKAIIENNKEIERQLHPSVLTSRGNN